MGELCVGSNNNRFLEDSARMEKQKVDVSFGKLWGPIARLQQGWAVKRWAEPRWGQWPEPTAQDCCAWRRGRGGSKSNPKPRRVRWERGQQNSRLTWLFWPGSSLDTAGGPGAELPDEVSQRSSSPRRSFPCCQALARGAAILELASGWLGNGGQGSRASRCLQSCGTAGESSAGWNSGCWGPGIRTTNAAVASCCVEALAWCYPISSRGITGGVPESLSRVISSAILWFQTLLPTQWVGIVERLASEGHSWSTLQRVLRCPQSHCLQLTEKLIWRPLGAKVPAIGTDHVSMVKVPAGGCLVWSGTLLLGTSN